MAKKKRDINTAFENWLSRLPESARNLKRVSSSGIEIKHLYYPNDGSGADTSYLSKLGFPGEYPFTRGVQSTMYRGRHWTMRQYSGFGTAEETNKRYRYLLDQGTTGLSVAFDLPTQMGRDSDNPLAAGEVGRVGVAISSVEDMEILFDRIPLEQISTSMTINSTAHILLAFYLALARKRGIRWNSLRGTVQNDILKEYIARGTYIYPLAPALKIVTDIFEFCRENVPEWNTISISGYHIREAGSTAVQELAFTFGNAIAYVESAIERGLEVDDFAPRLAFFFNCHNNWLEEIAKFRAARRIWARIMRERFHAKSDRSCMLRFHTQTAGSTLTAQQPQVNIIRTTMQALAAVLGGTQSLHTNSYDEALCLPTDETALLALRTQQVIANESGVADFIDPLAGSYALESLTDEIEKGVSIYLKRIEELGGMPKAIEQGFPQREIEDSAFSYQRSIETGAQKIVGVNCFESEEDVNISLLKLDPKSEQRQRDRLSLFRSKRDRKRVEQLLQNVEATAKEARNLMPPVIEAVENDVTLGEISDALRAVYGEYRG